MKRWLLAVIMTSLLAGCSSLTGRDAETCSIDPKERPAEVVTQPDLAEVPERASNLRLNVTSTLDDPVRLTVRIAGTLALDIEVPGTGSACSHEPVYRYSYRLPAGPVTVAATTDRGQRDTTTLNLATGKRWVVIQVQDGFPLHVEPWDSEPQWG